MALKGFVAGIETLLAASIFSVAFVAFLAGSSTEEGILAHGYSSAASLAAAQAQVQDVIADLYGSSINVSGFMSVLNSSTPYYYRISPFPAMTGGTPDQGNALFYRVVTVSGRLYYLTVYENETAD